MTSLRLVTIATLLYAASGCAVIQGRGAVDLNNDPPSAIANLPGLDETAAERVVAGRPYWKKNEVVDRHVLSTSQYEQVQDRLYVGKPAMPEYLRPVSPATW